MAKNYTLTEAIITAHENGDMEALADLGRRYPLLMAKVQRLVAKAGEEAVDLAQYFPEYLSANKVNKAIKDGAPESDAEDEDSDDDDADETPKKKAPAAGGKPAKGKKADDDSDDDEDGEESKYASMSSRDLWNLLGKLNARKACEKEFGDLKKGSMVKYLEKYGEGGATADDDEDDAEEETEGYEGKSAVELYKLCKSRKIKAEPKKPAKYYIDLLKKADAAAEEAEDEGDDEEEWDDDEEEAPAPKKSGKGDKKAAAKTEKPAKGGKGKKAAEDDDDDDEWEI